jgi:hypothetical protein
VTCAFLAVEQSALLYSNLGEEVPADAVALGQGEGLRGPAGVHAPEQFLEHFGIDVFCQIVAQQGSAIWENFLKVDALHLLAPDIGEHTAPAVGHARFAFEGVLLLPQHWVGLQQVIELHGVATGLV